MRQQLDAARILLRIAFRNLVARRVRTVIIGLIVLVGSLIVVVIGGLGNFWGAFVGALIIGEVTAFGILFLPQWAILFSYAVMALVLVFRPEGLLARRGSA